MKLDKFQNSFNLLQQENKWGRIIIAACMGVIGLLTISLTNQNPVVTIVPPNLDQEVTLHHNKAQVGLHQAWSLYLAETIGNVTPNTAKFARDALEPLLAPQIRDKALVMIEKQIDSMKRDGISFSFEPREAVFDAETSIVKVIGRHYVHASADSRPKQSSRTYEFKWEFKKYMPQLVSIDTYEDEESRNDEAKS